MNNVILKGRLVADPILKQTQSNISVTSFKIAVDKYVKDGEKQADFIECNAWRGTADFIAKYFTKGQEILIRGAIHNKEWTDKNNVKHYTYEVTADNAEFCGSKAGNAQPQQNNSVLADFDPNGFEEILSDGDVPF